MNLNFLWMNMDKETLNKNIEQAMKCSSPGERDRRLMHYTNSSKYTVEAWMNRGRPTVKIPFLKICKLSEELGIELSLLLKT